MARSLALLAVTLLAACGGANENGDAKPAATAVPKAAPIATSSVPPVESEYGTPVKDRSATLGLLNKRNNLTQDVVLKVGESRRIGNVVLKLDTCERTLPWEKPEEEGAFVQVITYERAAANQNPKWRTAFSGWLFKNSPSLSVVEHPIYDVWVKSCSMRFPGEEAKPAPAASASSAAKPSGTPSAKPSPTASPSPTAGPSPVASSRPAGNAT